MVDTFRPLDLGGPLATDDGVYAYSWSGGRRLGQEGRDHVDDA